MNDYTQAKALGLLNKDRWEKGIPHHPMSLRIMDFLELHDVVEYHDYFDWRSGGDGDNGEALMFELDAFFELIDSQKKEG